MQTEHPPGSDKNSDNSSRVQETRDPWITTTEEPDNFPDASSSSSSSSLSTANMGPNTVSWTKLTKKMPDPWKQALERAEKVIQTISRVSISLEIAEQNYREKKLARKQLEASLKRFNLRVQDFRDDLLACWLTPRPEVPNLSLQACVDQTPFFQHQLLKCREQVRRERKVHDRQSALPTNWRSTEKMQRLFILQCRQISDHVNRVLKSLYLKKNNQMSALSSFSSSSPPAEITQVWVKNVRDQLFCIHRVFKEYMLIFDPLVQNNPHKRWLLHAGESPDTPSHPEYWTTPSQPLSSGNLKTTTISPNGEQRSAVPPDSLEVTSCLQQHTQEQKQGQGQEHGQEKNKPNKETAPLSLPLVLLNLLHVYESLILFLLDRLNPQPLEKEKDYFELEKNGLASISLSACLTGVRNCLASNAAWSPEEREFLLHAEQQVQQQRQMAQKRVETLFYQLERCLPSKWIQLQQLVAAQSKLLDMSPSASNETWKLIYKCEQAMEYNHLVQRLISCFHASRDI